jgi:hypothetical protein
MVRALDRLELAGHRARLLGQVHIGTPQVGVVRKVRLAVLLLGFRHQRLNPGRKHAALLTRDAPASARSRAAAGFSPPKRGSARADWCDILPPPAQECCHRRNTLCRHRLRGRLIGVCRFHAPVTPGRAALTPFFRPERF